MFLGSYVFIFRFPKKYYLIKVEHFSFIDLITGLCNVDRGCTILNGASVAFTS
jgi:hypothetical protein